MLTYNIIAICGEAGSGKDTLARELVEATGWNNIVSCTTRPPREGEIDGKNYYFLSNEDFVLKIVNNDMLEATIFNDWCYGTMISSLDVNNINVGVFNPAGIEALKADPRIKLFVYYLDVPAKTRIIRQLNREENPDIDEIIRRYKADKEDFSDLDFGEYTPIIYLSNNTAADLPLNVAAIKARFS